MILGFKTQNNGKPTGFVEKIVSGQKIHTLRKDENCRWSAGTPIEFATGVRTKQYKQFMKGVCSSAESVFMSIEDGRLTVSLNNHMMYPSDIKLFAKNDGFDTVQEFEDWFTPLVRIEEKRGNHGLRLRLIQWTGYVYM